MKNKKFIKIEKHRLDFLFNDLFLSDSDKVKLDNNTFIDSETLLAFCTFAFGLAELKTHLEFLEKTNRIKLEDENNEKN